MHEKNLVEIYQWIQIYIVHFSYIFKQKLEYSYKISNIMRNRWIFRWNEICKNIYKYLSNFCILTECPSQTNKIV